jgi:arsenate reductase
MAAAWFNALANPAEAVAVSAGTQPASQIYPQVLEAMREVGVDLTNARPRFLDEGLAKQSSVLITMGCGEACPLVSGLEREDWPLTDPKGQSLESVRVIRDEIKLRVQDLLTRREIAAR